MGTFTFDIDEFLEHRAEREFTFPLYASSIGRRSVFRVKARRLQIMDRAALGFLPSTLQNEVWLQLKAASRDIQRLQDSGAEPKDINEALANNEKQLQMADILCKYGWIEPSVTLEEREHNPAQGVIYIGHIAAEDRIAYLIACNDADSEQARSFRTLREESDAAVPGGESREVLGHDASRDPRDTPYPVQFRAPVDGQ